MLRQFGGWPLGEGSGRTKPKQALRVQVAGRHRAELSWLRITGHRDLRLPASDFAEVLRPTAKRPNLYQQLRVADPVSSGSDITQPLREVGDCARKFDVPPADFR